MSAKEAAVEPLLSLKVDGPGVLPGLLPVGELRQLLEELEQLVKRAATLELTGESWTTDYPKQVKDECQLLAGLRTGSAEVVLVEVARQEKIVSTDLPLAQKATRRIMDGLDAVTEDPQSAAQFLDYGLVMTLYELLEKIPSNQTVDFQSKYARVKRVNISNQARAQITRMYKEPIRAVRTVAGQVVRIASSPLVLGIKTPDGTTVKARWDERHREILVEAFKKKKWIEARGIATLDPHRTTIKEIVIDAVKTLKSPPKKAITTPTTTPKSALLELLGAWPSDETGVEATRKIRDRQWGL